MRQGGNIFTAVLFVCLLVHFVDCSDSPEPGGHKKAGSDDLPGPYSPGQPHPAIPSYGQRSGGSDEGETETDDGETETESEGAPIETSGRPAKPGITVSSTEVIAEGSVVAPPEPAYPSVSEDPPLVVVGEPVQNFQGQLQHQNQPFTASRLFPYHQNAASGKVKVCCPVEYGSPYARMSRPESKPARLLHELEHVAAHLPSHQSRSHAQDKTTSEKNIHAVSVSLVVHPNQYPTPPLKNVERQENVKVSLASALQANSASPHTASAPRSERVSNNKQIVSISTPGNPSHPTLQAAAPQGEASISKQVVTVQARLAPNPSQKPSDHPHFAGKHEQNSLAPAPTNHITAQTVFNPIKQVAESSVPYFPFQPEHPTGAKQMQIVTLPQLVYPTMPPRSRPNFLTALSSSVNEQDNVAFQPRYLFPSETEVYGPGHAYNVQPGQKILSPSLLSLQPFPHSKYRVANLHSPLLGSLVPTPPGPKPTAPSPAHFVKQSVVVSSLHNSNVEFSPAPLASAAPAYYPATDRETLTLSKPAGTSARLEGPYPPPVPTSYYPHPSHPSHPQIHQYAVGVPYGFNPPPNPYVPVVAQQTAVVSQNELSTDYYVPVCALDTALSYCLSDPEYPINEIDAYIAMHPEKYQLLRPMVPWRVAHQKSPHHQMSTPKHSPSTEGNLPRSHPVEDAATGENGATAASRMSGTNCLSHENPSAKLLRATNEQHKWKCIVHLPDAYQTSYLEICDTNRSCQRSDPKQHQCHPVQNYSLQQMMVYSTEFGLHLDQIRIPRGCKCRTADRAPMRAGSRSAVAIPPPTASVPSYPGLNAS